MKNRLLNIQLQNEVQPTVTEIGGLDWVQYGDGKYKNCYPQYLIELYNNSATHAAVVNATAAMIAGEEVLVEETKDLQQYVALKKLMANIGGGNTLHELITKISFDLKLQGAYALNIIFSKDKTKISEIHHVPVEQVRVGKPNEDGKVTEYYISADWKQYRRKEYAPQRIAAFNAQDRTEASQLLYTGLYSPAMELYFTPDYVASTNWVQIDNLTSDFHLNNISNGFSGSYFINFANGIPTPEERRQIEKQITDKHSGTNNAGKFVLSFSDSASDKPEIIPIQVSNADKQYTVLNELCIQNIMIGHRVTSPMLLGVKTEGQLGGRSELLQAHELYNNSVVTPFQNIVLKTLKKLLTVNGITLPISIKNSKPLNSVFDADTLKDVLTKDELREQLGFEPLSVSASNETTDAISTISPLVATKVLDNMSQEEIRALIGLATTEAHKEAIKEARGENEVAFNSEYEDVKQPTDEELCSYIDDIFETEEDLIADGYELIEEEDVDENEANYNFSTNTSAITPTGLDSKSRRADGKFFKIRYVYRPLTVKENSRDFCKHMVNNHSDSLFRREDISTMSSKKANGDFGFYDIFKFKGRFNCSHHWRRRSYVLKTAKRRTVIDGKVYQKGDKLPNLAKNYKSITTAVADGTRIPTKTDDENKATKRNKQVGKGYIE